MKQFKSSHQLFHMTLATTMAVGAVVAASPVQAAATSFVDVTASHAHYDSILKLSQRGVVKGFQDGTFKPNTTVKRSHAAVIIAKVLGLDTVNVKNPNFKDVPATHPYYSAIAAVQNAGIIKGYQNSNFGVNDTLTRGQMATIIANAFQLTSNGTATPFTDIGQSSHKEKIAALYTNGVTKGKTATIFDEKSPVTRGQLASFIVRAEAIASQLVEVDIEQNIPVPTPDSSDTTSNNNPSTPSNSDTTSNSNPSTPSNSDTTSNSNSSTPSNSDTTSNSNSSTSSNSNTTSNTNSSTGSGTTSNSTPATPSELVTLKANIQTAVANIKGKYITTSINGTTINAKMAEFNQLETFYVVSEFMEVVNTVTTANASIIDSISINGTKLPVENGLVDKVSLAKAVMVALDLSLTATRADIVGKSLPITFNLKNNVGSADYTIQFN